MTTGQKWMSLFLLQAGLLGGAYAAGRYPEWKKGQAAAETAHKDYEKLKADARQMVLTTQARAVLMEAALAVRYGNFGMAFERVIRAQGAAQNLKLPIQKEFDELSALLIAQKPEVLDKILAIADKIEPPAKLIPTTDMGGAGKPAAMMVAPAGASPAGAPALAAGSPPPVVGKAAVVAAPPPGAVAAPSAPALPAAAAAAVPPRNASADTTIEQSRAALLAAKELIITGSEPAQVIAKIAHAQVVLEEGGHAEFAEQFTTAIKALRSHEETKARTALDAVLTSLRGL